MRLLADGAEHSGTALAAALGITRAAVSEQVRRLAAYGVAVSVRRGRGYQLANPLRLLDGSRIAATLRASGSQITAVRCVDTVASTSDVLTGADTVPGTLILAEHQSAGRGRRGRAWVSPFGVNLYLSLAWRYDVGPAILSGLSLALGIEVAEVLRRYAPAVMLKWPNDLWLGGRKLGGLLVDLAGNVDGPCNVVAGIGVNVNMRDPLNPPDQPWAALAEVAGPLDRSVLAAEVAIALENALSAFPHPGFSAYHSRWQALDALAGALVQAQRNGEPLHGFARGIDASGALVLETPTGISSLAGGDVNVRPCDS